VVPTFRSIAVYFDPLRTNYDALVRRIGQEGSKPPAEAAAQRPPIEVPVCYGGELGPDLPGVAAFARLDEDAVIALHAANIYRVFMVGFVAGFAYMGIVDDRIAVPRHSTPRVR